MKIALISDLHLDHYSQTDTPLIQASRALSSLGSNDVVCVAGDICATAISFRKFCADMERLTPAKLLIVLGYHDYPLGVFEQSYLDQLRSMLRPGQILLDTETWYAPNDLVRFVGATWWSKGVDWVRKEVAKPFIGATVVVTHAAPDTGDLVEQHGLNLWLHGQEHQRVDTRIGGTRIVCNPAGYACGEDHIKYQPAILNL